MESELNQAQLPPCPFCRGVSFTMQYESWGPNKVHCLTCGAEGPDKLGEDLAREAWSRRAAASPAGQAQAIIRDWRKHYGEEIFKPLEDGETQKVHEQWPGLVDRISAGMARHTCDQLIEELASPLPAEGVAEERCVKCGHAKLPDFDGHCTTLISLASLETCDCRCSDPPSTPPVTGVMPALPPPFPSCEHCARGSKPWQKNGVWLHEGGVVCSAQAVTEDAPPPCVNHCNHPAMYFTGTVCRYIPPVFKPDDDAEECGHRCATVAQPEAVGEAEPPLSWDEIEQLRHMAESWHGEPAWAQDLWQRAYSQLRAASTTATVAAEDDTDYIYRAEQLAYECVSVLHDLLPQGSMNGKIRTIREELQKRIRRELNEVAHASSTPVDAEPLGDAELQEAQRLYEATRGEWEVQPSYMTQIEDRWVVAKFDDYNILSTAFTNWAGAPKATADFVVAARRLWPKLVAQFQRLTDERDEARANATRWQEERAKAEPVAHAGVGEAEPTIRVRAQWFIDHEDRIVNPRDHGCVECVGEDARRHGFTCYYHQALIAIRARHAKGEAQ